MQVHATKTERLHVEVSEILWYTGTNVTIITTLFIEHHLKTGQQSALTEHKQNTLEDNITG